MHRFIVRQAFSPGQTVAFPKDEAQHAVKVLRLRAGENIEIMDGAGHVCSAELIRADREGVEAKIVSELSSRESTVALTLYMGLPKAEKLELIAQKFTELGGARLTPVVMSRSVARPDAKDGEKRGERLSRIALEAVKQSGRGYIPQADAPIGWKETLVRMKDHELFLIPWEEARDTRIRDIHAAHPDARDIALLIGPEGGISPEEAHEAAAMGAKLITLGPRILRAETAAIAASSLVMGLWGDV